MHVPKCVEVPKAALQPKRVHVWRRQLHPSQGIYTARQVHVIKNKIPETV